MGKGAYSRLKFESGAHRVQRVPATEAQGRIHTSTCTVAIMPEAEEIEAVKLILQNFVLTLFVLRVRAVNMSIKPIRRFASRIYPPALWWNVRMNVPSIKIKPVPCLYYNARIISMRNAANKQQQASRTHVTV